MQLLDEQLVLSASDLNNFLACPHLTTLDLPKYEVNWRLEPERGAERDFRSPGGLYGETGCTASR